MIESLAGKQIKNLIALQTKNKVRSEKKEFVVEGERICSEIPKEMLVRMYVSKSFFEQCRDGRMKFDLYENYEIVADKVFAEISQTITPQGVLAVVRQPEYSLDELIGAGKKTLMFLEDIRDPGNLGTILRTAEGADVDGIVMSKGTVDVFNPKVIRATMGAVYRQPFVYVDDFYTAVETAKKSGVFFFAAHLKGSKDYAAIKYPVRSAVMIGNEANGLSDRAANYADELVKIPMTGRVESLNASVAAAVLMYEIYRQRRF